MKVDESTISSIMEGLVGVRVTTTSCVSNKTCSEANSKVHELYKTEQSKTTMRNIPPEWTRKLESIKACAGKYLQNCSFSADGTRGWRLLPAEQLMDVISRFNEFEAEYKEAVEEFVNNYDVIREDAKRAQAGLWNPSEFPSVDDIRRGFSLKLLTRATPSATQAVRGLSGNMAEALQKSMTSQYMDAIQDSVEELATEAVNALKSAVSRLNEWEDTKKYKGLVDTFHRVADKIDKLNVTENPELDTLATGLRDWTDGVSTDSLKSKELRDLKIVEARSILNPSDPSQPEPEPEPEPEPQPQELDLFSGPSSADTVADIKPSGFSLNL